MRHVVAGLFITVDGVVEAPHEWQETFDEDMGEAMSTALPKVGTILLGRVTYEEWSAYWPTFQSDGPDAAYAEFINTTPKFVASTRLHSVQWGPFDTVDLLRGDVVEAVTRLKAQPGGDISVQGSPTLVNALLQLDLLDELTLYVHNVVAYRGKRLFTDGARKRLDLVDAKATRSGVVIATYRPRRG